MSKSYTTEKNKRFWAKPLKEIVDNIRDEVFLYRPQKEIERCINGFLKDNLNNVNSKDIQSDDKYYWFASEIEDNLFKALLTYKEVKKHGDILFRYVSPATLKHILEDGTITMSSLIGMNDATEVDYAEQYMLKRKANPNFHYDGGDSVDTYISSLSINEDSLMMWNMYGGLSKGAELVFDKNLSNNEFTISKVEYAKSNTQQLKLNYIHKLLNKKCYGKTLQLRKWHLWQHFFKPYYYKDEQEIRLLYQQPSTLVLRKDWYVSSAGVYIPFSKFRLFDSWKDKGSDYQKLPLYPLKLKGIVLGPLFPEIDANINAFKNRFSEQTNGKFKVVSKSLISDYRG